MKLRSPIPWLVSTKEILSFEKVKVFSSTGEPATISDFLSAFAEPGVVEVVVVAAVAAGEPSVVTV
ncbi:hypothetical protein D3C72_2466150 [compost metagenome]